MALLADHRVDALENVLQLAGVLHRQPRTYRGKDEHQQHEHHQLHGYVVRDRRLGMGRMQVENAQNRVGHAGKILIQKCGYPELLRHDSRDRNKLVNRYVRCRDTRPERIDAHVFGYETKIRVRAVDRHKFLLRPRRRLRRW